MQQPARITRIAPLTVPADRPALPSKTRAGNVAEIVPVETTPSLEAPLPRMYTYEEAAELLMMSKRQLQRLVASRRIGYLKLGKKVLFLPDDLRVYLESLRVPPVSAAKAEQSSAEPPVPFRNDSEYADGSNADYEYYVGSRTRGRSA